MALSHVTRFLAILLAFAVLREGKELLKGEFQYVRDMFHESLVDDWPRYRVEVPVEVPVEVSDGDKSGATSTVKRMGCTSAAR